MAAGSAAKGALHLINWGKKIIPATADEIIDFGPNAARVKGLLSMIENMSPDAAKIPSVAKVSGPVATLKDARKNAERFVIFRPAKEAAEDAYRKAQVVRSEDYGTSGIFRAQNAAGAEVVSDLITPADYRDLTNPMAAARRFDMTVPNAPEGFTNIARSLGERGLITGPKEIELARRVSMLSPDMQQVYLNLLGENTDPVQLLQALRLMGQ
jgi:hypothetical protein